MANSLWKDLERRIAALMGGERVPVSGRTGARGMESPDIMHDTYAIEIKQRDHKAGSGLPKWQTHAQAQAEASRKPHHLAAICIIHHKNQRLEKAVVQMSLKDFLRLDAYVRQDAIDAEHSNQSAASAVGGSA